MIVEMYIMLLILAFIFMSAGLYIGANRRTMPGGKGIAVLCFMLSTILFIVIAMNSLNIEVLACG